MVTRIIVHQQLGRDDHFRVSVAFARIPPRSLRFAGTTHTILESVRHCMRQPSGIARAGLTSRRRLGCRDTIWDTLACGSASRSRTQRSATSAGSRRISASRAGFIEATLEPARPRWKLQSVTAHGSPDAAACLERSSCQISWPARPRAGFVTADHEPAHHGQHELNSIRGRYLHDIRHAEEFRTFGYVYSTLCTSLLCLMLQTEAFLNLHLYEF